MLVNLPKGITVERLDTFCQVVQSGSIAAAALNDPTRQSQFSKQIKDLEKAIGNKLVTRVGKVIQPTDMGLELAALAGSFFKALSELTTPRDGQRVAIAAGDSVIRWFILPLLTQVSHHPARQWRLCCMRTLPALEAIRTGVVDLAIIREDAVDNDFTSRSVGQIDYNWVFHRTLLPGRTGSGIFHAKRLPIGTLAGDGVLARQIRDLADQNNLPLEFQIELESFSLLLDAVKTTRMGALLPRVAAAELPEDQFAIISDESLRVPPRTLALVALTTAYNLRPGLRRAFDELAHHFMKIEEQTRL